MMKMLLVAGVVLGLLTCSSTFVSTYATTSELPTPKGLMPCAPGDPVAAAESRVAIKIGAEFLSCFRNVEAVAPLSGANAKQSVEYAFSLILPVQAYTPLDLDALLLKAKQQWKEFDPLSADFKNIYTARLEEILN